MRSVSIVPSATAQYSTMFLRTMLQGDAADCYTGPSMLCLVQGAHADSRQRLLTTRTFWYPKSDIHILIQFIKNKNKMTQKVNFGKW